MNKKVKWFWRLTIWMMPIFVFCNVLVKAAIWPSASIVQKHDTNEVCLITLFQSTNYAKYKYTTALKQKFFNGVDNLLAPGLILLFANIAVRLVKTPQIFDERD